MEKLKAKAYDIIAAIHMRQTQINNLNATLQNVQKELERLEKAEADKEAAAVEEKSTDTEQSPPPSNH